jgi:hypothetical protein
VDRDVLLLVLIPTVCGFLTLIWGPAPSGRRNAERSERSCWWRLWAPLVPGLIALSLLAGWAAQEPSRSDEALRPIMFLVAALFALIWARAFARAVRDLRRRPTRMPAATVGFLRPRVIIAPHLARTLDPAALRAAEAHEAAHARHRDPLRIWLAHIAADLQWPWPQARQRLRTWRHALEEARDDEARSCGIDGVDLAAAILGAARLGRWPEDLSSALTGDGSFLEQRVVRLLSPGPVGGVAIGAPVRAGIILVGLVVAATLGFVWGDDIVRALPGVIP